MRILTALLLVALTLTVTDACSKAAQSPTAPTPQPPVATSPTPTPTPTTVAPLLTLQSDTNAPVGQAVAITYASRMQDPGKIAVAVTVFNLQNFVSANISGVTGVGGRLKYDDTVLDIERSSEGLAVGDFMRQGEPGNYCCLWQDAGVAPGVYPFFVSRVGNGRNTVQGSGEVFLARFQPKAGVTSATTRIELATFEVDPALGGASYSTTLLMSPYGRRNMIENTYGATVTIRPGS